MYNTELAEKVADEIYETLSHHDYIHSRQAKKIIEEIILKNLNVHSSEQTLPITCDKTGEIQGLDAPAY